MTLQDRTGVPCDAESCTVRITHGVTSCTPHQYYSGVEIRRMRWAGQVGRMGDRRDTYRVFDAET